MSAGGGRGKPAHAQGTTFAVAREAQGWLAGPAAPARGRCALVDCSTVCLSPRYTRSVSILLRWHPPHSNETSRRDNSIGKRKRGYTPTQGFTRAHAQQPLRVWV